MPPDEHSWVESFGRTLVFREYRNRVWEYYRRNYPLTEEARARWNLNPGNGGVSRLCRELRVYLAVLEEMLAADQQRVGHLLSACKNLTHIKNGCYRLYLVEWNIGESARALAAFCLDRKATSRQVRNEKGMLTQQGVEIAWPRVGPR